MFKEIETPITEGFATSEYLRVLSSCYIELVDTINIGEKHLSDFISDGEHSSELVVEETEKIIKSFYEILEKNKRLINSAAAKIVENNEKGAKKFVKNAKKALSDMEKAVNRIAKKHRRNALRSHNLIF